MNSQAPGRPAPPRPAPPPPPQPSMMRCPICLAVFEVPGESGALYRPHGGSYVELARPANPLLLADVRRSAFFRCPDVHGDMGEHYLPWAMTGHRPPVVIGLVGASGSGKTHLLTSMIAEIERGALARYDLRAEPVDFARHAHFRRSFTEPLVHDGRALEGTREGLVEFADALLVTSPTGVHPVVFFDVAGEDLLETSLAARFLLGATALIFVVDPGRALGAPATGERQSGAAVAHARDETFEVVLSRRAAADGRWLDIPAAVVLNKADRLRFEPPVDRWLRADLSRGVDPAATRAESRDVFTYLYENAAHAWLEPFRRCRRCTLHVVSATGGEAVGRRFVRGVRPRRVLAPLLALFAMTGVLAGGGVEEIGS